MTTGNTRKTTSSGSSRSKSTGSRNSSTGGSASRSRSSSGTRKTTQQTKSFARSTREYDYEESSISGDLYLLLLIAVFAFLFLSNFRILGAVGAFVSNIMFGVFGLISYILPLVAVVIILFRLFNRNNSNVTRKLIAGVILCLLIMMICDLAMKSPDTDIKINIAEIYGRCSEAHKGGGVIGGFLAFYMVKLLGGTGTWLITIVLAIICFLLITGRSILEGLKEQGQYLYDETHEERRSRSFEREARNRDKMAQRKERLERKREMNDARERERILKQEEKENEQILRMERVGKGVTFNTTLEKPADPLYDPERETRDDEHLIRVTETDEYERKTLNSAALHDSMTSEGTDELREITPVYDGDEQPVEDETYGYDPYADVRDEAPEAKPVARVIKREPVQNTHQEPVQTQKRERGNETSETKEPAQAAPAPKKPSGSAAYRFPPPSLLSPGKGGRKAGADKELKEVSERMIMTLETFGVKAKVTDVSRGPAVTRYEIQPELGVKVSKIVGLSDDLKLALAATDIRIEAPIPGKSAVGIEVPNKENEAVAFRDLVESQEFRDSKAALPFAVGKDLSGQIIVHDIAKMPHVLIAGATGSGKSVCINTIIMSILYKCRPEDVRLILIDPKMVELSVYNTIPHLMLPVVTDPKKAAGALQWAVKEMNDRYARFMDAQVRDLKGYNSCVEESEKLPHILIIVDELADLMMVAPGEVEESICRIAQLARACGIHLVVATQRPSVDVITGLIKANMPSRVAFAVSSGVDSRTILDMVGAEKLLGKGDMLFAPQGYPKPVRVQGAFIPDPDVNKVADFFKEQAYVPGSYNDIEVDTVATPSGTSQSGSGGSGGESSYDEFFAQAGRFIIDKDKASIGALQRLLRIGFNRAARIMDQLAEAGVVGEEQGTKAREILMDQAAFEALLAELGIDQ